MSLKLSAPALILSGATTVWFASVAPLDGSADGFGAMLLCLDWALILCVYADVEDWRDGRRS